MRTRALMLILAALLLAGGLAAGGEIKLGLGGGFASTHNGALTLGTLEAFAETNAAGWLSPRFTIAYIPPLLPAEDRAALLAASLRAALGSTFRPLVAAGVGAIAEPGRFGGIDLGLAWTVSAGLELQITQALGIYAAGSLVLATRPGTNGMGFYAYSPWALGVFLNM